ncbi:MAG TPA: GAF domain-containing protein [Sphingomicrobium sp.]|nr:GAF domain-containing protein [Sphingomicrobium sp.]
MEHADSDEQRQTLRRLLLEAETELNELEKASTPEIAKNDAWLDLLANRAVDQAMGLSGAQFASLQVFDETREHLIILAQRNLRAKFLHHLSQMKPGDGSACGRCLAEDAPAVVVNVQEDGPFKPHLQAATEAGIHAAAAFPVRDGSAQLIAVLSIYFEAPRSWSDDEMHRMSDFADAAGKNLEGHLHR